MRMTNTGCYFSKTEWGNLMWEKVSLKEDEKCTIMYKQPHQKYLPFEVTDKPYHLIWWILADQYPEKLEYLR